MTATVRVLSAGGNALPHLPLTLSAQGAAGVPRQAKTGDSGLTRVTLTPSGGALKLTASVGALPSTLPRVFKPTAPSAASNGQRLALPASQTLSDSATGSATKTQIQISTTATPTTLLVVKPSEDKITIANAGAGWSGTVRVRVYGPARTADTISCSGAPAAQNTDRGAVRPLRNARRHQLLSTTAWTGTLPVTADGTFTTQPFTVQVPGYYTYRESIAASGFARATQSACADTAVPG